MIDGKSFSDQPVRNKLKTGNSIRKLGTVCWTIIISKTIIKSQKYIQVNKKHLLLYQKQYNKSVSLEI